MVAPLVESTHTVSPVFYIDSTFFMDDEVFFLLKDNRYSLYIDFGDGSGEHKILIGNSNYINVLYPNPGEYEMVTTMYCNDGNILLKRSVSTVVVGDAPIGNLTNYEMFYTQRTEFERFGLRVFEFMSECSYEPTEEKIIFILSGYNPTSFQKYFKRQPTDLFQKYIIEGNMEPLLSFGYKFVIVDWEEPNDDIRFNAERFMSLLNEYKCNANNEEQFVVIGHSMGSLIGRYALTAMENLWQTSCLPEKMHNTRLFISNDGPHQGVNIPMSLQCVYGDALGPNGYLRWLTDFMDVATCKKVNFTNTLLEGISVKQMLNRHYSTGIGGECYTAADEYYDFFTDLENIGNYPQYCKMVALSNGSMEGIGQQNVYYDEESDTYYGYVNEVREPNDHLFNMDNELSFKVLGFSFGTQFSIDLRSNPNEYGLLIEMSHLTYKPKLELYWFGVRVNKVSEWDGYSRYGYGLLPYCVSSGGSEYFPRSQSKRNPSWGFDLGFLGLDVSIIPGSTFAMYSHIGIPWLFEISDELCMHTDGLGFGFVPTTSAFDYGHFDDENINIDFTQLYPSEIFEATPFDVLIGRVNDDDKIAFNGNHEDVLNPILFYNPDVSGQWGSVDYICDGVYRYLLNLEIGDYELYLDNNELIWDARVSAYGYVHYDERTPYYSYDNLIVDDNNYLQWRHPTVGAVSREEPYVVNASLSEYTNTPGSSGYWCGYYDGIICCYVPSTYYVKQEEAEENRKIAEDVSMIDSFSVVPTIPAHGGMICLSFPYDGVWAVNIYSMMGELVHTMDSEGDKTVLQLPSILPVGIYFVQASSDSGDMYTTQIIVQ